MRTYNYYVKTEKRYLSCRDRRSAEYIYSCNKHARIIRHNRHTGVDEVIAEK